jgi:hypothetical protein
LTLVDFGSEIVPPNVEGALVSRPAHVEVNTPECHPERETGRERRAIKCVLKYLVTHEHDNSEDARPQQVPHKCLHPVEVNRNFVTVHLPYQLDIDKDTAELP